MKSAPRLPGKPSPAEWLLRHLLPLDGQNDAIRGDMLEEFRRALFVSRRFERLVLARGARPHHARTWVQETC